MKRILLVSPTPTHPQIAGNRARVDGLLTGLQQLGHDVYFCHVQSEHGDEATMREKWGDRFFAIPYRRPRSRIGAWKRKVAGLVHSDARYTYSIDAWYAPSIDSVVSDLHERFRFDVVIVEYVFFSRLLECFDGKVMKIIDTHDVFTDRHRKYLDNGQVPRWFSTTRNQEAKALNRADIVIAIQDKERAFFSGLTSKPVITVEHIVSLQSPREQQGPGTRLLFVASDNPINTGGINHFIAEILPEVRRQIPGIELALAGSVCNAVADAPGIVKLGRLDDLTPVYDSSSVVINPVLFNTGLSIKNLEALGYSKPLVTSSASAEGLSDGAGLAFLVADKPREFADHIVKLCRDKDYAAAMARRAYEFAAERNRKTMKQLGDMLV